MIFLFFLLLIASKAEEPYIPYYAFLDYHLGYAQCDDPISIMNCSFNQIELLIITNYAHQDMKINFNKLPTNQVAVIYIDAEEEEGGEEESNLKSVMKNLATTNFDGTKKSYIDFARKIKRERQRKVKKNKEVSLPLVQLVGNIKEKVSMLIIIGADVEIVDNNLDIDTLHMLVGSIKQSQYKVSTNYFEPNILFNDQLVTDEIKKNGLFDVNNYNLYNIYKNSEVIFYEDNFTFKSSVYSEDGSEQSIDTNVPYEYYKNSGGLILMATEDIDINLRCDQNLNITNFNITAMDYYVDNGPFDLIDFDQVTSQSILLNEHHRNSIKSNKIKVNIKTYGECWESRNVKKITLNGDTSIYEMMIYDGNKHDKDDKKLSSGAIAGIVIGCVAFVAIVVVVVIFVLKKTKVGVANSNSQ